MLLGDQALLEPISVLQAQGDRFFRRSLGSSVGGRPQLLYGGPWAGLSALPTEAVPPSQEEPIVWASLTASLLSPHGQSRV